MSSEFILLTQDNLSGINVQRLQNSFEEFALFVFTEKTNFHNKDMYHNALIYTRVELLFLVRSLEEKAEEFMNKAIKLIDEQIIWVREQILSEYSVQNSSIMKKNEKDTKLQWTGTQVEFVELVYSLHDAGSINKGNISLKELFSTFGGILNFVVADYYRYFSDITHRTGDRTLYLDKLKRKFMQHLSKSDAL